MLVLAVSSGWPTWPPKPSPPRPLSNGRITHSTLRNMLRPAGLAVVELVEVAHRLHDRLEIRARIECVEQLRSVGQQRVGSLNRDPDIVLRRIGQAAMSGQEDLGIESLDTLQRLDVIGDRARA